MLSRLDGMTLTDSDIEVIDSPFLRGPKRLQLAFEPAKVGA